MPVKAHKINQNLHLALIYTDKVHIFAAFLMNFAWNNIYTKVFELLLQNTECIYCLQGVLHLHNQQKASLQLY